MNFYKKSYIITNLELTAHKIHIKAIGYVKAKSQATIMHVIENDLTEEESYIYKRGRNANLQQFLKMQM